MHVAFETSEKRLCETLTGDTPMREKGPAGSWNVWGEPLEHDAGLSSGKRRGKADRWEGRRASDCSPGMRKSVVRPVGSPQAKEESSLSQDGVCGGKPTGLRR